MTGGTATSYQWIWPSVGATPVHQGLDSEMFDRVDYPYSETFVREAIQNSLDARLTRTSPVRVKFTFHTDGIGPRRAFLEQIVAHRQQAGLDIPEEWINGNVRWLLVEDFNTSGLAGDLGSRTSDFWNYWLNFGVSNKDGSGRGGRGIGRVTFLIASQLQSVIGHTRRAEDEATAVCGMSVLRAREIGDDLKSTHAYLAEAVNNNIFSLYDSSAFHSQISDVFGFDGYSGPDKSGLGLAILYPHSELKPEGILAAAIENFAPAITAGDLIVEVNGEALNAQTIHNHAAASASAKKFNDGAIQNNPAGFLELVTHAQSGEDIVRLELPNALPADYESLRETPAIKALQKRVIQGERVAVEIAFPLVRNHKTETVSLRVAVETAQSNELPIDRLFRDGMSLPDVRSKTPYDLHLVATVSDGLLATYLNFCEGKAHLDLLESKDVLEKLARNGFDDGSRIKRLVKNIPSEVRQLLTPEVTAPDAHIFDTFFSKPSNDLGKRKKPKDPATPDDPLPLAKPTVFKVESLDTGFRIVANPDYQEWPVNLNVKVAYADGSRRPSWTPFDFKLDELSIESADCTYTTEKNALKVTDCGPDTQITVTGFDNNRELDTTIRPWKNA